MPNLLRLWWRCLVDAAAFPTSAAGGKNSTLSLRVDELEARIARATFLVNTTADSLAAGSLRSVIEAADAAAGDDVIHLPAGTYKLSRGQLNIDSNISIFGVGSGPAIIDAQSASRVVQVAEGATVRLVGLTLQNGVFKNAGDETAGGGGIFNEGDLSLERCVITANKAKGVFDEYGGGHAAFGGGIFNFGTLQITDSLITANQAKGANGPTGEYGGSGSNAYGGAIFSYGGVTIMRSTLSNNTATGGAGTGGEYGGNASGGGLYTVSSHVLIENSTLSGNKAIGGKGADGQEYGGNGGRASGGGIFWADATLTIRSSTLSGNKAVGGQGGVASDPGEYGGGSIGGTARGGGLYASITGGFNEYGGDLIILNSTFSANKAKGGTGDEYGGSGLGGAIYLPDNAATKDCEIINTTIAFNSVTAGDTLEYGGAALGGGIFNEYGGTGGPMVLNTIVAKNTGDVPDVSGGFSNLGDNLIGVDPKLGALASNGGFTMTHALLAGSPALNAAAAGFPANDQRGALRPVGAQADIGAFESGATFVDLKLNHKAALQGTGTPQTTDDFIVYTLVVKNVGTAAATSVVLTDTLSTVVTFDSATSTQGSCTHDSGVVTCDIGNIAAGATVTVTIKVKPPAQRTWVGNFAAVAALQADSTPANNSSTVWIQAGS